MAAAPRKRAMRVKLDFTGVPELEHRLAQAERRAVTPQPAFDLVARDFLRITSEEFATRGGYPGSAGRSSRARPSSARSAQNLDPRILVASGRLMRSLHAGGRRAPARPDAAAHHARLEGSVRAAAPVRHAPHAATPALGGAEGQAALDRDAARVRRGGRLDADRRPAARGRRLQRRTARATCRIPAGSALAWRTAWRWRDQLGWSAAPAPPRSYTCSVQLDRFAEDQLPAVVIVSPGTIGVPELHSGTYDAVYGLVVGVYCSASTDRATHDLVRLWCAALLALPVQSPSLGGVASRAALRGRVVRPGRHRGAPAWAPASAASRCA